MRSSAILLFCILCCVCSCNMKKNPSSTSEDLSTLLSTNRTTFTRWSSWSRCLDCYQRRMKTCISAHCGDSTIYEERLCRKKRCKRKLRSQKTSFNVVHVETQERRPLTKQGLQRIWSKWSRWSLCSDTCRTQRIRMCRKPGRCKKQQQEQTAYCYHENSICENYVLNLLGNQKDSLYENSPNGHVVVKRRDRLSRQCGHQAKAPMLKIIGGTISRRNKWPWHVAIINKYHDVFCAGTLIAPRWVLTASHCIRPYLRVRLNEHDLRARDGRELEMTIHKVFQHPEFNYRTVDNDIALLQLPRAVRVPVACLPEQRPKPKQMCAVMGWGKVRANDTYGTSRLHEAKLPVVRSDVCKRSYRNFLITSNMLCAGWPSGKADTCAGDSGGGLICPFRRTGGRIAHSVQGITSFGDGCGLKNKYGIYTTVFNYINWIYYIIDLYS